LVSGSEAPSSNQIWFSEELGKISWSLLIISHLRSY